jgi:hypothetical protein
MERQTTGEDTWFQEKEKGTKGTAQEAARV